MIETRRYRNIFHHGYFGKLEVKNRIVMPAITTNFANSDGSVSERMIDYYEERAKGGVGLIIVECTTVEYPYGKGSACMLSIHDESMIPSHNRLVESVHRNESKIALQISHLGIRADPRLTGRQPSGPSAIQCKVLRVAPRELTLEEIQERIRMFVGAAEKAKRSGYDAVELHAGHGHLVAQFMSPYFNGRTDSYGGGFHNRMRFPLEIIKGIKDSLGSDFPIIFRLSGDEFVDNGRTLDGSIRAAKLAEEAGVEAIHVTAGIRETYATAIEPMRYDQGWKVFMAQAIKKSVRVPVIAVGVIRDPQCAEDILRERRADFVAVGRGLVADAEWPGKAAAGEEEDIRPCISCNYCYGRIEASLPLRCAVNPDAGFEKRVVKGDLAKKRKKVMVIGGGPAGLEAARSAAKRGHQVLLFEKKRELGGQLRLASLPPGKNKIDWLRGYLIAQNQKLGVVIHLGIEVDERKIEEVSPDVIVLATGARPEIPDLNVEGNKPGVKILTAWDVLEKKDTAFEKAEIVVLGGFVLGCEIAEYLAEKGHQVTIVCRSRQPAMNTDSISREDLLQGLDKLGVTVLINCDMKEIVEGGINIVRKNGDLLFVRADGIISTRGVVPENRLKGTLNGKANEIYWIGDSKEPGQIADAILDGLMVGRRV